MTWPCTFKRFDLKPAGEFFRGEVLMFCTVGTPVDFATYGIVLPEGETRPIEVHLSDLLIYKEEEEIAF